MTRHPAAYVRKSTRKTEESPAAHLAAIQTIATADGNTIADEAVYPTAASRVGSATWLARNVDTWMPHWA